MYASISNRMKYLFAKPFSRSVADNEKLCDATVDSCTSWIQRRRVDNVIRWEHDGSDIQIVTLREQGPVTKW